MDAIGQLAGGVAHDFNNMLAIILGCADLLRLQAAEGPQRACAENIVKAASRSADLTRQLLAFARKGKNQSATVNVHEIIDEVVQLLGRSLDKRIRLQTRLEAPTPLTAGDPSQLQSALLNLAINARDAMPDGGEITLATGEAELGSDFRQADGQPVAPGRYLRITVRDTGQGMSEAVMRRIFEPFFTTKEPGKGTGLGLAAVYGIVRSHNGAIAVQSAVGQGTTFELYFPIEAPQRSAQATRPAAEAAPSGGGCIMIVDDEALVREMAGSMLHKLGYRVIACKDGAEAIAQYQQSWRTIDLVIMDMIMPAMNGRELFTVLRQINHEVRIIISSGYSINEEIQALLDRGVRGFLGKPFAFQDLAAKVAEVIEL